MVKLYLAGFAALGLLVVPTFTLPISPSSSYKYEVEYAARSNQDKFERYTKDLALETANPPPEGPGKSFHVLAARNDGSPTDADTDRDRKYNEAMRAQGLVETKTGTYVLPDILVNALVSNALAALPGNATLKDLNPQLLAGIEDRRQKDLDEFAGDESLRAAYVEDVEAEIQEQREMLAEAEDMEDYESLFEVFRYEDAYINRGTPQEKAKWDAEDAAASKAAEERLNEGKPPGLAARDVFQKFDEEMRARGFVPSDDPKLGDWILPQEKTDELVAKARSQLPANATLKDLRPGLFAHIEAMRQKELDEFVGDASLKAYHIEQADYTAEDLRELVTDAEDQEDYDYAFQELESAEAFLNRASPQEKAQWEAEDAAATKAADAELEKDLANDAKADNDPTKEKAPSKDNAPGNENVPDQESAPGKESTPEQEGAPGQENAPGKKTARGDDGGRKPLTFKA